MALCHEGGLSPAEVDDGQVLVSSAAPGGPGTGSVPPLHTQTAATAAAAGAGLAPPRSGQAQRRGGAGMSSHSRPPFSVGSHSTISNQSAQHSTSHQRETNRRLVTAENVGRICEIVEHGAAEFNAVNVSTAFHRMAKLWASPVTGPSDAYKGQRADHCIRQLGELALLHLRNIQGQGLGIVVWSLAKINFDGGRMRHLLQAFAQEAVNRLTSTAYGADASLKLGAQSLSNMLYAYALLNHHPGTELLSAIASGVKWQLRDFSPQGLSNTVWSVAKLGAEVNQEVTELLEALAQEAVSQLQDERARAKFIPQNLSNMLYGFAQLGVMPSLEMLEAVGIEAQRQLSGFGPQELTNIMWALAKLLGSGPKGREVQAFIDAMPSAALHHLNDDTSLRKVKPQTLSNLLYAFAAMDFHPGNAFLTAISLAIQRQVHMFKPQELASSLWGLAKLRHHPGPQLVSIALTETCRQVDKFKLQDLVAALHALAVLGSTVDGAVAESATRLVNARASVLGASDHVNLLWALAVSDQLRGEAASVLLGNAATAQAAGSYTDEDLLKLAQVRAAVPDAQLFVNKVPPALVQRIDHAAQQAHEAPHPYKELVRQEVSEMLTMLDISHNVRSREAQGAVTIDIVLPNHQIAMQLDGPSQFFATPPFLPVGDTLLQWRLLLTAHWKVLSVPFYAWQQAVGLGQQQAYLQHLLGLGNSCIAFNQNAGLAPLGAVISQQNAANASNIDAQMAAQMEQLYLQHQQLQQQQAQQEQQHQEQQHQQQQQLQQEQQAQQQQAQMVQQQHSHQQQQQPQSQSQQQQQFTDWDSQMDQQQQNQQQLQQQDSQQLQQQQQAQTQTAADNGWQAQEPTSLSSQHSAAGVLASPQRLDAAGSAAAVGTATSQAQGGGASELRGAAAPWRPGTVSPAAANYGSGSLSVGSQALQQSGQLSDMQMQLEGALANGTNYRVSSLPPLGQVSVGNLGAYNFPQPDRTSFTQSDRTGSMPAPRPNAGSHSATPEPLSVLSAEYDGNLQLPYQQMLPYGQPLDSRNGSAGNLGARAGGVSSGLPRLNSNSTHMTSGTLDGTLVERFKSMSTISGSSGSDFSGNRDHVSKGLTAQRSASGSTPPWVGSMAHQGAQHSLQTNSSSMLAASSGRLSGAMSGSVAMRPTHSFNSHSGGDYMGMAKLQSEYHSSSADTVAGLPPSAGSGSGTYSGHNPYEQVAAMGWPGGSVAPLGAMSLGGFQQDSPFLSANPPATGAGAGWRSVGQGAGPPYYDGALHASHSYSGPMGQHASMVSGGSLPPPSLQAHLMHMHPAFNPGAPPMPQGAMARNSSSMASTASINNLRTRSSGSHNALPGALSTGHPPRGDSGALASSGELPLTPISDLRRLWALVSKPGFGLSQGSDAEEERIHLGNLKRLIESLPLEASAVTTAAPHLATLTGPQFAALLKELASDNHAYRAWQMFDWVRALPAEHGLARLCDSEAYTTMIALCGPWQQLRRALQLIADMRAQGIECGVQAHTALLGSAVKCGESELAADVYGQLRAAGFVLTRQVFHAALEVFLKLGRWQDAVGVMDDMTAQGLPVEAQTYNLVISSCIKLGETQSALDVYKRMWKDGVTPTTKTFVSLISAFAKGGALDVVVQAVASEARQGQKSATYAAAMGACEKAGQWQLAVQLFQQISDMGVKAEVGIFNSIVAACAHSGEHVQARAVFDAMPSHSCQPDAVTFANLIRAYKKGGQWCQTVATLEAMQAAGAVPHAAVISSVIDALWHTGIVWAQARAAALFRDAVPAGRLAGAADLSKKGTLRVDLQALTVGVALLAMHQWLASLRAAAASPEGSPALEANRKLAVINGMGDHSRAQGNSSAVKEAIGASLIGAGAPFRLVADHLRCGRLEAATQPLTEWLLSDSWAAYSALFSADPSVDGQPALSTEEYLAVETAECKKLGDMFEVIRKYEATHCAALQALGASGAPHLGRHRQLVAAILAAASSLGISDQVAHVAAALMDATVAAGGQPADALEGVFIAACLRIAAANDGVFVPSADQVATLFGSTGAAVELMESDVRAVVRNDTACISALHVLKLYAQRLGCALSSPRLVKRVTGSSFLLITAVLADPTALQWPPSLVAAAVLISCRRRQGCIPAWPTSLAAMTGYSEGSGPPLSAAIAFCDRLGAHLSPTNSHNSHSHSSFGRS